MQEPGPLTGITVLDVSQGIAGPSCAGHFAQYGARVIKVEPPTGDWIRKLGTQIAGTSSPAIAYNRGKESVALDLKRPQARDIVLKVAARAQVLVENARPGAMDRLGLGFEAVEAASPGIVYVSVSGWGQRGPSRAEAMVDTVAQAVSGLMSVTRDRELAPVKVNTPLIDAITGLYAFQAAIMELWSRKTGSGRARHLDISLLQAAAHIQAPNILEYGYVGGPPGLLNPPAGNYPTRDGWVAITLVNEAQFAGICTAIGRPEMANDTRFNSFQARKANITALTAMLDDALATRTTDDWVQRMAAAGALASRINTYGDWLANPHVTAVGAAPAYALADGRTAPLPHLPGTIPFVAAVPRIGQHTAALLAEAGLSAGEIDDLLTRGIARGDDGGGGAPS